MEKYDWVKKDGEKCRGIVTSMGKGKRLNVRWAGKSRAEWVSATELKKCKPAPALYLEGSPDRNLESTRSASSLLRTWLDEPDSDHHTDLRYKNIHCLEDVRIIGEIAKNNPPVFIHIACHGGIDKKKGPFITLDPLRKNEIYFKDEETIKTFNAVFAGLPVLLSACELGNASEKLKDFRSKSALGPIAAYSRGVDDHECMLFELMLYHGLYINGETFSTAVKNACDALGVLGCRGSQGRGRRFALIM